jgi:hypothetical protein
VARPIKEVILSRTIGGTKRHGWLMVIIRCKREKNIFCENNLRGCGRMFLAFTYKLRKKHGGMCYTTKCDTMEDGLMERASVGNLGG